VKKLRDAIDTVRVKAGLPVFNTPLIEAVCEKCKRAYFWRPGMVPKRCPWPNCGGEVKSE